MRWLTSPYVINFVSRNFLFSWRVRESRDLPRQFNDTNKCLPKALLGTMQARFNRHGPIISHTIQLLNLKKIKAHQE